MKKTLKYGSASVILAIVFIALVFVLNLVVTSLTERFNLFVDLTEEQLYEISDASHKLLENMGEEEIKFIFLTPLDELDNNEYTKSVKTLAEEYAEKYPNVTLEYVDMLKNPGAVSKYRRDYDLSATTVIVESAKRFTAFDMSECFVYTQDQSGNYQYYAFNAEYRFTSSLIKVTREEMPRALFVTNHGETVPVQLKALLVDAGFTVENVDLSQKDIPEDAKLVIVNDPQTDFTGIESEEMGVSEITKLSRYLEKGGNAMIFVSPATPELKNLDELMGNWGIGVLHGYQVVDDINSVSSMNSLALITRYVEDTYEDDETDFSVFHKRVSEVDNPIKTVSHYTAPLEILPLTNVTHSVAPILSSYGTSYIPESDSKNLYEGAVPVLVAGARREFNEELGETEINYLIVGGSTYLASDVFLGTYRNTYANTEIMKSIVSEITDETMLLDVSYKVYNDTSLTIDNRTSQRWLIALVAALPAAVLLGAFLVFLKRRHL
ncbi:MAG: GldG family protein [Clostridia bacterium]|nr:GldG family protein [Clostridia bacterium]